MLSIFITINILTSCAHSNRPGQKLTAGGPNDINVPKWSVIFELAFFDNVLTISGSIKPRNELTRVTVMLVT